jgi:CHAD domain-containing protein
MDLRSLSKRLAKAAANFRQQAIKQPLVKASSARLRSLMGKQPRGIVKHKRETTLELYVAQAHIATGHAVADHIAGIVQKRLTRLVETRNFETAKDPVEALHDFRVASRRLRAFVDVFEPLLDPEMSRRAIKPLRRITRAVRTVRDWDVQIDLMRGRLSRATTEIERIVLEDLLAISVTKRKLEAKLVRKRLRNLDFDEINFVLCATLGALVTRLPAPGPATAHFSWELLEPFARAISENRVPDDGRDPAEWLHQFRIHLKKLRYALELFEPALGTVFEQLYAPVEELQELLGQHHDLVVLAQIIERHRRKLELMNRDTLAHALISMQERLVEERQVLALRFQNEGFDPALWQQTLRGQLALGGDVAS